MASSSARLFPGIPWCGRQISHLPAAQAFAKASLPSTLMADQRNSGARGIRHVAAQKGCTYEEQWVILSTASRIYRRVYLCRPFSIYRSMGDLSPRQTAEVSCRHNFLRLPACSTSIPTDLQSYSACSYVSYSLESLHNCIAALCPSYLFSASFSWPLKPIMNSRSDCPKAKFTWTKKCTPTHHNHLGTFCPLFLK